jgi:hypothetical protein
LTHVARKAETRPRLNEVHLNLNLTWGIRTGCLLLGMGTANIDSTCHVCEKKIIAKVQQIDWKENKNALGLCKGDNRVK